MARAYFTYVPSGLSIGFINLSSGNPDSFNWNFGFQSGEPLEDNVSTEANPTVVFPSAGTYQVSFTITEGTETSTVTLPVLAGVAQPGSPYSIFAIIDMRFPNSQALSTLALDSLIKKWQLFLADLIDPHITGSDIYNETKWPSLVNELIANLIIYDTVTDMLTQAGLAGTSVDSNVSNSGGLKRVVTGPSEAEWYSGSESVYNLIKSGGTGGSFYDQIIRRICILSQRLRITLEMCRPLDHSPVVPQVMYVDPVPSVEQHVPSMGHYHPHS